MSTEQLLKAAGFVPAFGNVLICGCCEGFRERKPGPDGHRQRCRCHRRREPKWDGRDFNERVHLCECCVQHIVPSGSKFSVWFCPECKERVDDFNARVGVALIPIGRHSFMNGVRGRPCTDETWDAFAREFSTALHGMIDRIDTLDAWSRSRLHSNLEALELVENEVPLSEYLLAMRELRRRRHGFGKKASFVALVHHFRASAQPFTEADA